MVCNDSSSIRNIGIIAHIDAGKTTLSERILFYCQKIHKIGEVHDGAATMDFMPEEQERGITISSACTTCKWHDTQINLIDTPGHVDFTMEVERCLRVLDGAIGVFCAVGGVEPQSETVWRQSEGFNVPKLVFINKMDRQGASFEAVLEDIRNRLGANVVALTIPLGQGPDFNGVIDLLTLEKLTFEPSDQGRTILREQLSDEELNIVQAWRDKLLENLADVDDEFLALWLEGRHMPRDIQEALRRATFARKITPAFCGSALRNIGVQPLLDAISAYLPSPQDAPAAMGMKKNQDEQIEIPSSPEGQAVALVFKVVMENARKNCFVRLYSGTLRDGDCLCNSRTGKQDRVSRLYRLNADRREQIDELCAGDIAALVGLTGASTGDTYCGKGPTLILEPIVPYAPVITLALEPKNADEGKILDEALGRYTQEDPTLKLAIDEDSGLRMLSGMGELHLDVVLERLEREYKTRPRAGSPQVVMRETVNQPAKARFVFDRELGKERHKGEAEIEIAPRGRGEGNIVRIGEFLPNDPVAARKLLPQPYVDAVLEGVKDGLQSGVLAGWPLQDVEITISDIVREEGLTTIPGLRMAAAQALKEALQNASPVYLEPLMDVEISVPEEYLGSVLNLLQQCSGRIEDMTDQGGIKHLRSIAPLRKLFGFSTELRSATQGRAGFMQSFNRFDQA